MPGGECLLTKMATGDAAFDPTESRHVIRCRGCGETCCIRCWEGISDAAERWRSEHGGGLTMMEHEILDAMMARAWRAAAALVQR